MNQLARLSLVDRSDADLSIAAQCRLLKVARSTLYHRAAPMSADDLRLMRCLDEQYLATPHRSGHCSDLHRDTPGESGNGCDAE